MLAVWSDQFRRALCQTVPSPFGGGSSDPGVASCSLHSLSFRATPSRKVCRRCVRRGALTSDHAQLTAATSVELQFCPPARPCQAGELRLLRFDLPLGCKRQVYRPEQHREGVRFTLSRNDGAATGLDLDMAKMTVAATLGAPASSAEGSGCLGYTLGRVISAGHLDHHFRLPQRQHPCAHRSAEPNWAGPEALLVPNRVLEPAGLAAATLTGLEGSER
jgi:hypothetical protein